MGYAPARTALYTSHVESGANLVDFHGFELPIWYSSIKQEHLATRSAAGIFDVSHMGLFRFVGKGVSDWLTTIGTQDFTRFHTGTCGYTHFLDTDGNIIDDMIFAIKTDEEIIGVPNASMVSVMLDWFTELLPSDGSISVVDNSEETSIIAIQGPKSMEIVAKVLGDSNVVGRFKCQDIVQNNLSVEGWIQGTGYTGEAGVEIFIPNDQANLVWKRFVECGAGLGLVPVGLGARDTLRLEKGYLLSGQDFHWPGLGELADSDLPEGFLSRDSAETSVPFGLNMGHEFIGKERVLRSLKKSERWTAIRCVSRGPSPRPGHPVMDSDSEDARVIGYVTSGAPSPSLNGVGIAMAYLSDSVEGKLVWIRASSRRSIKAEVVRVPFL
ncbi:MAG: aminomethyltransferase family protein [Candidatus Thalassarchaeaceae archaeon]